MVGESGSATLWGWSRRGLGAARGSGACCGAADCFVGYASPRAAAPGLHRKPCKPAGTRAPGAHRSWQAAGSPPSVPSWVRCGLRAGSVRCGSVAGLRLAAGTSTGLRAGHDVKARELYWKPMAWLGAIRPTTANDAFDPALWETFVSTTLGVGRPARRRAEGGQDGGWRLRVAAVAYCEADDRVVNSASLRAAKPRSLDTTLECYRLPTSKSRRSTAVSTGAQTAGWRMNGGGVRLGGALGEVASGAGGCAWQRCRLQSR